MENTKGYIACMYFSSVNIVTSVGLPNICCWKGACYAKTSACDWYAVAVVKLKHILCFISFCLFSILVITLLLWTSQQNLKSKVSLNQTLQEKDVVKVFVSFVWFSSALNKIEQNLHQTFAVYQIREKGVYSMFSGYRIVAYCQKRKKEEERIQCGKVENPKKIEWKSVK